MGALEGRVAIITGAGRGIGREHALLFASEGAKVVVNDLGGDNAGNGADSGPARDVVDEITAAGGTAVASTENVATWSGAESVVLQAIAEFGRLDVVVNNAGILRDSFIAGMEESHWDAVIAVHLKGHFAMLRHAAAYWKSQSKAGDQPNAAVINTASGSGVTLPNAGQANYGSAKAGIAAMTLIAAEELERYGVRVNAIAPIARTRMTAGQIDESMVPELISPFVAYLCHASCAVTGQAYSVGGGRVSRVFLGMTTGITDPALTAEMVAARIDEIDDTREFVIRW